MNQALVQDVVAEVMRRLGNRGGAVTRPATQPQPQPPAPNLNK